MKLPVSGQKTAALTLMEVLVIISIVAGLVLCFLKTKSDFHTNKPRRF